MLGVGIVGLGYWGPNYLRVLKQLNYVESITVCDMDPKKLEALADTRIRSYQEYTVFLKDDAIKGIIIATPPATHYPLAKQALNSGKHLLIEKPVTLQADEAQELSDLAQANDLTLATGHIFVYNDGISYLKEHIAKPEFGQIHEIECVRQGHGPIRSEINVMWDLATHDIAILLYLLEHTPTAVSAQGFKYRKNSSQEDSVILTLQFPEDVYSTIKVNWQYPIKERRVTIIGSQQMIRFSDTDVTSPISIYDKNVESHGEQSDPEYGSFKMITKDAGYRVPSLKIREPLSLQIQDFLDAITNKRQPKSNAALGVDVIRILEAAQTSLKNKGKLVQIEDCYA